LILHSFQVPDCLLNPQNKRRYSIHKVAGRSMTDTVGSRSMTGIGEDSLAMGQKKIKTIMPKIFDKDEVVDVFDSSDSSDDSDDASESDSEEEVPRLINDIDYEALEDIWLKAGGSCYKLRKLLGRESSDGIEWLVAFLIAYRDYDTQTNVVETFPKERLSTDLWVQGMVKPASIIFQISSSSTIHATNKAEQGWPSLVNTNIEELLSEEEEQSFHNKLALVTHFKSVGYLTRHAKVYLFGPFLSEGVTGPVLIRQLLQVSFDRTKGQLQFVLLNLIRDIQFMPTQRQVGFNDLAEQELIKKLMSGAKCSSGTNIKMWQYVVRFYMDKYFLISQMFYFLFRALKLL
jgi:hypothetical protein